MNRSISNRLVAGAFLVGGVGVLIHPLYLERLLVYPGVDWSFLPLIHAMLSALGILAVLIGIAVLRHRSPKSTYWIAAGILVMLLVPFYGVALTWGRSVDPSFPGTFVRRSFVAALVASAFLLGNGIADTDRLRIGTGLALPTIPLIPVVVEWTSGARFEPILELHFVLTGAPLQEVPYFGSLVLLVAAILGVLAGRITSIPSTEAIDEENPKRTEQT